MWSRLAAPALWLVTSLAWSSAARAADKGTCLRAYETAQNDQHAGKLRAARGKLLVCVEPECPALLRADCATWLNEVERNLPTVVVVVRSGGKELSEVRLLVDDEPLAESLTGAALEVDPGRRTFRLEAPGHPPVERTLIIRQGEKNRRIAVELSPESRPSKERASVPAATWVLAGVGAVGLVGFSYFGLKGLSGRSDLNRCKGECAQSDVDAVQADFTRADVSLAIGALALGGAAYFYFSAPAGETSAPAVGLGVAPRARGVETAFQLSF